jgi:hypothetical protein
MSCCFQFKWVQSTRPRRARHRERKRRMDPIRERTSIDKRAIKPVITAGGTSQASASHKPSGSSAANSPLRQSRYVARLSQFQLK